MIDAAPSRLPAPEAGVDSAFPARCDRRPVFLVSERTQFGNLGDIVLNRVLLELLAEHGSVLTLRAEGVPRSLEPALDRLAEARLSPPAALRRVLGARLRGRPVVLCLNPGGYGGGVSLRALLGAASYVLARMAGLRLVRIGFSLGPVTPARRRLERWQSALYAVCAVRDRQSRAELADGRRPSPHLLPDLALLAHDLATRPGVRGPRSRLLVSLRSGTAERRAIYRRLAPILRAFAAEQGLELAFVAQVAGDVAPLRELASATGSELHVLGTDDPGVLERIGALYGSGEVLVTNRLHAGIFAAMHGCIPLALVDPDRDSKILALMRDAGLRNLLHDEADADSLVMRLRSVLSGREVYARRLDRAARVARLRGRQHARRLLCALNSRFAADG